jgi:hypothetical protein
MQVTINVIKSVPTVYAVSPTWTRCSATISDIAIQKRSISIGIPFLASLCAGNCWPVSDSGGKTPVNPAGAPYVIR